MNNFSPNMLKTFETCPIKYYLKYVQKISVPQKSYLFEKGKKVHALANYYLRGDDITKLESVLNPEEKIIWETLKQNKYFQKSYVNSEYNLSCRIDKYWIGGRIDALVRDDKFYYILDYKTGQIPKNPQTDFQTIVYLLCVYKKLNTLSALKNEINLKFVYIDLKNNQNCLIDFDDNQKYNQTIIDICNKIETFEPPEDMVRSKKCEFCEFKKVCF